MDKGKWTGSSKIEAEGLEWLYNDPTQQQNNLESYLLGESIPGARGELRRTELEEKTVGSVLTDSSRVYEQTLNKFREDPLFIIKKLETQQQQIIHKYANLQAKQRKSGNSERELRRGRERERHKDREGEGATHRDRERERDKHKEGERERHKDRGRGRERERYRRSRSNSPHRKSHKSHNKPDSKSLKSHDSHGKSLKSHKSPFRRVKGPERPRRYDPMKYAFGVNEDICPPDEILETANRKMQMELLNQPTEHVVSVDEQLDSMIQEGKLHIKDKLEKLSNIPQSEDKTELTAVDSVKKEEYLMSIKRKAFEEANLSNILKHKHNKLL